MSPGVIVTYISRELITTIISTAGMVIVEAESSRMSFSSQSIDVSYKSLMHMECS